MYSNSVPLIGLKTDKIGEIPYLHISSTPFSRDSLGSNPTIKMLLTAPLFPHNLTASFSKRQILRLG